MCWFFRLLVTGYGLYAPFVDNKCEFLMFVLELSLPCMVLLVTSHRPDYCGCMPGLQPGTSIPYPRPTSMGADPDLTVHVSRVCTNLLFRPEWVIDMSRLATTSLIIARRAVASANGNPEFDAALVSSISTLPWVHGSH